MELTIVYTFDYQDGDSTNIKMLHASVLSCVRELKFAHQILIYTLTPEPLRAIFEGVAVKIESMGEQYAAMPVRERRYVALLRTLMAYRTKVLYLDHDTLCNFNQNHQVFKWLQEPIWFCVYAVERWTHMRTLTLGYPAILQRDHPWDLHPVNEGFLYFRCEDKSFKALADIIALNDIFHGLEPTCPVTGKLALTCIWYSSHVTHALFPPAICSHLGQDFTTLQSREIVLPPAPAPMVIRHGSRQSLPLPELERQLKAKAELHRPYQGGVRAPSEVPIFQHYGEERRVHREATNTALDAALTRSLTDIGLDWEVATRDLPPTALFPYGLSLPGCAYRDFEEPTVATTPQDGIIFYTFTPVVHDRRGDGLIMLEASILTCLHQLGRFCAVWVYSTKPHLLAYLEDRYPGVKVIRHVPEMVHGFFGEGGHFRDIGHARYFIHEHLLTKFCRPVLYIDNDTFFPRGSAPKLLEIFRGNAIYGCRHETWMTYDNSYLNFDRGNNGKSVAGWKLDLSINPINNGTIFLPYSPEGMWAIKRLLAMFKDVSKMCKPHCCNDMLAFSILWYATRGAKLFYDSYTSEGLFQPSWASPPRPDFHQREYPLVFREQSTDFPTKACGCQALPPKGPPLVHYYYVKEPNAIMVSHMCAVLVATYLRTGHVCINEYYLRASGLAAEFVDPITSPACTHDTIFDITLNPTTPRTFEVSTPTTLIAAAS